MKRQLIAVILMLAVGLQGSIAAFAATSPSMSTDCQSSSSDAKDACCPKGQFAMSCCLDLCLINVGVTVSPATLAWYVRPAAILPARISTFSSRGDSPLIRPPIL
jgi:hypothetical protein